MELRHLKYFLALAEEMNFNRAARRLNLSQPPLSRQIQLLEHELGTSLLEREGKRFRLTEAGEFLKKEGARILNDVGVLERQVGLIGGSERGFVRIGYVGSIMFTLLPDLLNYIKTTLPEMRLDIVELATEGQANAILTGRIDLGFLRSWVEAEGIIFMPIGEEMLSIIYPPSFEPATGGGNSLTSFSAHPYITLSKEAAPGLFERIFDICSASGFTPAVAYECSQFSSIMRLVAAGLGWSIIPSFGVRKILVENIRSLALPEKIMLGVAYRSGTVPPRIKRIVDSSVDFIQRYLNAP
jgi:DNA-binding transcriptional LysR family regulator